MTVPTAVDTSDLLSMYRRMVQIRLFEERVADLISAREIRTSCQLCIGQEAIFAGVAALLEPGDVLWGENHSHGRFLACGCEPHSLMAEIFGCEELDASETEEFPRSSAESENSASSAEETAEFTDGQPGTFSDSEEPGPAVSAGSRVAVNCFRASEETGQDGTRLVRSLQLAARQQLPVLFLCETTFDARLPSVSEAHQPDSLLEVASSLGIPARQIDGNDAESVLSAVRSSVLRARRDGGPTFLDCRAFRWPGPAEAVREWEYGVCRKEELLEWVDRDPLPRTTAMLQQRGVPEEQLMAILDQEDETITAAVAYARRMLLQSQTHRRAG